MTKPLSVQYAELVSAYRDVLEHFFVTTSYAEGIFESLVQANDNTDHVLSQADVDVLKDLLQSSEYFFESGGLLPHHRYKNVPNTSRVFIASALIVRDCEWMNIQIKRMQGDLAKAATRLSDDRVKTTMQGLADSSEKTHVLLKLVVEKLQPVSEKLFALLDSLRKKEDGEKIKQLEADLNKVRGIGRRIRANEDEVTVADLAIVLDISQQAVSKRIQRLIRDHWLNPPSTSGKQYWSAQDALVIQQNPKGRCKRG